MERDKLLRKLIELQYSRNDIDFKRSTFRVRGDAVEIFPASNSEVAIRVEFFGDEIDRLYEVEALTGNKINELAHVAIFPASQYAVGTEKLRGALSMIEEDLRGEVRAFEEQGKILEAQRLKQRTEHDLEMMREIGYCSGIENYSRYFDGRSPGEPSFTLARLFPCGKISRIYRRKPHDDPADPRHVSRRSLEKDQSRRLRLPHERRVRQPSAEV